MTTALISLPSYADSTPVETVDDYEVPIAKLEFGVYDWMEGAVCASVDPELFFAPHQGSKVCNTAKKVCAGCPVRAQCLNQALKVPAIDDFGVWGGTPPPEREEIRRQRRRGEINLTVVEDGSVSF